MGAYSDLPDSELVRLLDDVDRAAFAEVYSRYWRSLYDFARNKLHGNAQAEDIVQDVFMRLMANSNKLNIQTSLKSYLFQAVRNGLIDHFHKDSNRQKYANSLMTYYNSSSNVTSEMLAEREMKERIDKIVAGFPEKMRQVYVMSRVKHLSRDEIAKVTNTSKSTIDTQLNRALNIIRKLTALFF